MTVQLEGESGNWLLITPVGNVLLTDAVKGEFRIEDVLFVTKKKLPYITRRFDFKMSLPKVKTSVKHHPFFRDFFNEAETYAVLKQGGKQSFDFQKKCVNKVRDALSILSTSQLGYQNRKQSGYVKLLGEHNNNTVTYFMSKHDGSSHMIQQLGTKGIGALVLSERWKKFQKTIFFFNLIKILNKEIPDIEEGWRQSLRRVSILVGKSINSSDVPSAFLCNMIVLEILLATTDEKFEQTVPPRVEAFLGWVSPMFSGEDIKERIKEVYNKRGRLVHTGNREDITAKDLLFTDVLVMNLLINVVGFPSKFRSKREVIEFTDKYRDVKKWGLKTKVQLKFKYLNTHYNEEDLNII